MELRLRPLHADDLDALVALDEDPEVMRHITGGEPTSRRTYIDHILPRWLGYAESRAGMGVFVIEDAGDFLGWAMLRPDTFEPAWAEVGYRLRRDAWGHGIATWAARELMGRAFEELGADVVSARTVPENAGSRRVMEKLGMRFAGTFEFPERRFGELAYYPAIPGVLYVRGRDQARGRVVVDDANSELIDVRKAP